MKRLGGPLLGGALCGLAWGVVARLWMRFIATDPAFTWSGTLYIVGAASLAGAAMGLTIAVRRGWSKVVGILALLPLGMGAGTLALPTILFGSLAARRRTLPAWARAIYAVLAGLPLLVVLEETAKSGRGVPRVVAAMVWYLGLSGWMIAMASVSIGSTKRAPSEGPGDTVTIRLTARAGHSSSGRWKWIVRCSSTALRTIRQHR